MAPTRGENEPTVTERRLRARFRLSGAPTTPTTEGIEKYLGSGMIRGIGPIYARKLVRAFGDAFLMSSSRSLAVCRR